MEVVVQACLREISRGGQVFYLYNKTKDIDLKASELMQGQGKTVRLDADISGLACGDYDVQAGLFFAGTGDCCSFGIEGRISDGYYEGRLILEL